MERVDREIVLSKFARLDDAERAKVFCNVMCRLCDALMEYAVGDDEYLKPVLERFTLTASGQSTKAFLDMLDYVHVTSMNDALAISNTTVGEQGHDESPPVDGDDSVDGDDDKVKSDDSVDGDDDKVKSDGSGVDDDNDEVKSDFNDMESSTDEEAQARRAMTWRIKKYLEHMTPQTDGTGCTDADFDLIGRVVDSIASGADADDADPQVRPVQKMLELAIDLFLVKGDAMMTAAMIDLGHYARPVPVSKAFGVMFLQYKSGDETEPDTETHVNVNTEVEPGADADAEE